MEYIVPPKFHFQPMASPVIPQRFIKINPFFIIFYFQLLPLLIVYAKAACLTQAGGIKIFTYAF